MRLTNASLHRYSSLLALFLGVLATFAAHAAGTGLTGEYFTANNFTGTKTTRTDPTVDFDWGSGTPGFGGLGTNNFSVRWSGLIEPRYSENYTFYVTADDGAMLWINERLVSARTFSSTTSAVMTAQVELMAGQRVAIRLEFIETTGNARVRLEWASASQPREVVPQTQLYPTAAVYERGSILREHWTNVAGTAVSALTGLTNYPNNPTGREFFLSFECLQTNWADDFGTRVTGYIVPPASGNYTFAAAAADTAQLWLSTDTNPANKQLIASVTNATAFRDWINQTNQVSTPRALLGGQKYYVELLHKAGVGDDHWSVAWQTPGASNFVVITSESLVPAGLDRTVPTQTNFLNTLSQGHPRLFATLERFEWLSQQVATNPTGQPAIWYNSLYKSATNLLTNGTVTFALDIRGTLLDDVRTMLDRIYKLAISWRLTGDTNFPERAWLELTNAGGLTNWNDVDHFLDTAEMSHTFAVAYDWMYDYWSTTQRTYLRTNMETKGLLAGLKAYSNNVGWSQSSGNNWNLVCNGGLSMAALALGTDSESLAEQVLTKATASLAPVMRHWSADNGAWYEGPGYWDYASDYNYRHLTALESALGSDFGLSKTNGLSEAGLIPLLVSSANNRAFNFADAGGTGVPTGAQLFYWARRFYRPEYANFQRAKGGTDPLGALWYDTRGTNAAASGYNCDHIFHGATAATPFDPQEVGVMRSGWNDSRETWLAFKGGEMGAAHGDLDAGTFVLEALGKRWAWDLGSDDYALPGYFDSNPASPTNRWDYYRMRAEGQNTIVINNGNGPDTKLGPVAPVILFQSETNGGRSMSVIDLTPIATNVTRAWRGFQLFNGRKDVLVQDEIVASTPASAWWFMHVTTNTTQVAIDPDGSAVTLTQGTDRLWLKILSGGGTFALSNAIPLPGSPHPAGQNVNSNYAKLAIRLTGVTNTTLAVWMKPLAAADSVPSSNSYPALIPLANWTTSGNETPFTTDGNVAGNEDNSVDIDLWNYVSDAETPLTDLRFTVLGAANGSVTLLADGHTARFTPVTNYFGAATFSFTVTDQSPDSRLLFHYDFEPPDLANTNTVPDRSLNGRDGTLEIYGGTYGYTNATPAPLGGLSTRALGLFENGSNSVVRLTRQVASNEFNFSTNDWTFTTWVQRVATSNDDFILHLGNSGGFGPDNSLSFYFPAGATQLALRHYINTNTTDVSVILNGFATNQWRHLALVHDNTNLLIYVDGAPVATTNGFNFAISQTLPVQIGGTASTNFQNQRYLNGYLDDTAMFAAALSAPEIAALAGDQPVASLGGASSTNVIGLNLAPVNDAPTAAAGAASIAQGQFLDFNLLTVASDVETISSNLLFRVTNGVNGNVTLLADGHTARFTPTNTFSGAASFAYVATDTGTLPTPFLHYSFEPPDLTGDNLITDNSGNNRNGTLTNFGIGAVNFTNDAPPQLAPESTAISLYQSSTNGSAKITRTIATNDFNPNDSSWTFSGWFNRDTTVDDDFIFYLGTANGFGPENELHLHGQNGQPHLRLHHYYFTNSTDIDLVVSNAAAAGTWHHVAVVFNRTNSNTGDITLYVDGAIGGTTNGFTLGMPRPTSAVFGGHTSTGVSSVAQRYFNGQLDDLVLFTNALSASDVALLAARPMSQYAARRTTNTVTVTVTNSPPSLNSISNRVVGVGQTILFTNSATDPQAPPQVLTFALLSTQTNATLTTNTGVFNWRVPVSYANTTNTVLVKVADNGSPVLSATQSFTVTVLPLTTPAVSSTMLSNGRVQLTITGAAGPDYTVQGSTNLPGWTNLLVTNSPTLPLNWIDTNAPGMLKRFYRVLLGP